MDGKYSPDIQLVPYVNLILLMVLRREMWEWRNHGVGVWRVMIPMTGSYEG